jgi:NAD(P)-dependent dehydrogenase (short-subunit alcohol dehydrogenase family)
MDKKTIAITGVTQGLGRAMTDAFISEGHRVAGSGRNVSAIDSLKAAYPEQSFSVVDITDFESVAQWRDSVLEQVGVPDILINNAGIINANAPLWEVSVDEFSNVMDVNIKGTFHVIKVFCPSMIDNGGGTVVNFSSTWGRSVSAEVAPYCASKFAVEGLTKALAEDLPGAMVTVALNPGVIHTKMLESCFGAQASGCIKPAQWAEVAVPKILGITKKDNGASLSV